MNGSTAAQRLALMFFAAGYAMLFAAALSIWAMLANGKARCERDTLDTVVSPDESWRAVLVEEACSDGAFVTTVTYTVQLVRRDAVPRREDDIFAIDAAGQPQNSVSTSWTSPHELHITIPNKSAIGLRKDSHEDIDIVVKRSAQERRSDFLVAPSMATPANASGERIR